MSAGLRLSPRLLALPLANVALLLSFIWLAAAQGEAQLAAGERGAAVPPSAVAEWEDRIDLGITHDDVRDQDVLTVKGVPTAPGEVDRQLQSLARQPRRVLVAITVSDASLHASLLGLLASCSKAGLRDVCVYGP